MGGHGRLCEAVGGSVRPNWEAEVGGCGRPKWEAMGGRSGRPWEAVRGQIGRLCGSPCSLRLSERLCGRPHWEALCEAMCEAM